MWAGSDKPFLFLLSQGHDTTLDPTLHDLWVLDLTLRHRDDDLPRHPSPRFPDGRLVTL